MMVDDGALVIAILFGCMGTFFAWLIGDSFGEGRERKKWVRAAGRKKPIKITTYPPFEHQYTVTVSDARQITPQDDDA